MSDSDQNSDRLSINEDYEFSDEEEEMIYEDTESVHKAMDFTTLENDDEESPEDSGPVQKDTEVPLPDLSLLITCATTSWNSHAPAASLPYHPDPEHTPEELEMETEGEVAAQVPELPIVALNPIPEPRLPRKKQAEKYVRKYLPPVSTGSQEQTLGNSTLPSGIQEELDKEHQSNDAVKSKSKMSKYYLPRSDPNWSLWDPQHPNNVKIQEAMDLVSEYERIGSEEPIKPEHLIVLRKVIPFWTLRPVITLRMCKKWRTVTEDWNVRRRALLNVRKLGLRRIPNLKIQIIVDPTLTRTREAYEEALRLKQVIDKNTGKPFDKPPQPVSTSQTFRPISSGYPGSFTKQQILEKRRLRAEAVKTVQDRANDEARDTKVEKSFIKRVPFRNRCRHVPRERDEFGKFARGKVKIARILTAQPTQLMETSLFPGTATATTAEPQEPMEQLEHFLADEAIASILPQPEELMEISPSQETIPKSMPSTENVWKRPSLGIITTCPPLSNDPVSISHSPIPAAKPPQQPTKCSPSVKIKRNPTSVRGNQKGDKVLNLRNIPDPHSYSAKKTSKTFYLFSSGCSMSTPGSQRRSTTVTTKVNNSQQQLLQDLQLCDTLRSGSPSPANKSSLKSHSKSDIWRPWRD